MDQNHNLRLEIVYLLVLSAKFLPRSDFKYPLFYFLFEFFELIPDDTFTNLGDMRSQPAPKNLMEKPPACDLLS